MLTANVITIIEYFSDLDFCLMLKTVNNHSNFSFSIYNNVNLLRKENAKIYFIIITNNINKLLINNMNCTGGYSRAQPMYKKCISISCYLNHMKITKELQ